MTYVTFTDHNRIDGCLEIAEFPDVFISEEITTQFPDDHVNIYLLLWNLTESQHVEIQQVRRNIFELREYLAGAGISHAVAHPLYDMTRQLTADHIQKLVLLFKHFEGILTWFTDRRKRPWFISLEKEARDRRTDFSCCSIREYSRSRSGSESRLRQN